MAAADGNHGRTLGNGDVQHARQRSGEVRGVRGGIGRDQHDDDGSVRSNRMNDLGILDFLAQGKVRRCGTSDARHDTQRRSRKIEQAIEACKILADVGIGA